MNRRFFLLTIFFFNTFFVQVFAQKFSFVFMSDVHYTNEYGAPVAFKKVIDTVNKMKPDFIMVGGDMVYDALRVKESQAVNFATSFLKEAAKMKAPKYYAVGNHDVLMLYEKNADTTNAIFGKKFYDKYFGKRYYSFNHKGWHFISLDDIFITAERKYVGRVDDEQLNWLKSDLANIDSTTPVVMMLHVPLISTLSQWYGGGTTANNNKIAAENTNKVLELFKNYDLKLVLQGHLHYFEALNVANKTTFITAPSVAGKWWHGKQNDVEEGFIKIDVTGKDFTYKYIDYKWDAKASMNNEDVE